MAVIQGRTYLPGGVVRPTTITYTQTHRPATTTNIPSATPRPAPDPSDPRSREWWRTEEGRKQVAAETSRRYPDAPYTHYVTDGGYWWGVTPSGMRERLNPSTQQIPRPSAAVRGPGVGAKTTTVVSPPSLPPGVADRYTDYEVFDGYYWGITSGGMKERLSPIPGGAGEGVSYVVQGPPPVPPVGSTKAQLRGYAQSVVSWERSTGKTPSLFREQEIYESLLRPDTAAEQQYRQRQAQQQATIISSGGNLTPTSQGYVNMSTGEIFTPTVRAADEPQTFQYYTTTTRSNPFQGIPLLEQAAAAGDFLGSYFPQLREMAKPVVTGGQQIFSTTPLVKPVYETGQHGLPDIGAIYEEKEDWASSQVKKLIPDEMFKSGSELARKYGPTVVSYVAPALRGPEMVWSVISKKLPEGWNLGPATLGTEYALGMIEGVREEPLKTGLIYAATFALPAVLTGGSRLAARSPTLTRLATGKYSRYIFGKVPVQGLATKATKWENVPVLGKLSMKLPVEFAQPEIHHVNLPLAAAEVAIGVPWIQSVVERTTGLPPRLTFDSKAGRLTWDVQADDIKPPSEGIYQLGRITATEIAPAFAGLYTGMKATAKGYGWLRSRGVPEINLTPEPIRKPDPISYATKIRERFAPKKEVVPGGIGYEWGYPISQKITEDSLMHSFREGTLLPRPDKIFKGAYGGRVQYVPEHAFLKSDIPGESYIWTGWEHQPTIGQRFKLGPGKTPKEMTGQFGAPVAESYFTKASEVGDFGVIGWDLPVAGQPTLVRTQVEGFYPIPKNVRTYAEAIKKSQGKEAYGRFINAWVRQYGKEGYAHLPLHKAEYEGILPSSIKGKLTEQEALGIPGFVRVRGARVPIVRTKYTGMVEDITAPAAKPLKGFDQLGRRFGGFHGRRTGTHGMTESELLNKLSYTDRRATEELFNIARKIESGGMEVPAGKLDLALIERIGPRYAKQVEKILREEGATIYGSAGRTGEMPISFIKTKYGKPPADVDIRVPNFVRTANRIQKTIKGSRAHKTLFGIEVQVKHGSEWQTVADVHPNKIQDFFGWTPRTVKRGGLEYEPLSQQIIRAARGSLAGRENVSGQWKWGPKPHRTEKDIQRFYTDVQFMLSKQPKSPQVTSISKSMRALRKHPTVAAVVGKQKFQYGPGRQDYFAGLPLSYYRGKRGFVNIPVIGVGTGAYNLIKNLSAPKPTPTYTPHITPSVVPPVSPSIQPYPASTSTKDISRYIGPSGKKPSTMGLSRASGARQGKSSISVVPSRTVSPGISQKVSEITGVSRGRSGTSRGRSGISIPGVSGGISGGSGGRSGISGGISGLSIPGISGGSGTSGGRSGLSGGISGISSYISGGSSSITRPPSFPPTFPPTFPPPTFPPTQPPLFPPTHRPTYFLEEEKPKQPKLRLHFDVLGSKWIIENPIPRPGNLLAGEPGKQPKNELEIYEKHYSKKKYLMHLPFEQFTELDSIPNIAGKPRGKRLRIRL